MAILLSISLFVNNNSIRKLQTSVFVFLNNNCYFSLFKGCAYVVKGYLLGFVMDSGEACHHHECK